MFIYGSRLYGKVDKVPGLGHVATRFIHIDFVPLIPTGSFLVLAQAGKSFRGVPIPLSFKSIAVTWLRAASLVAGILGAIFTLVGVSDSRHGGGLPVPAVLLAIGGIGIFSFLVTHRSATKAGYARAIELGKLVKLNANGFAALAQAYGQAPPTYGFEPLPVPQRPTAVLPLEPEPIPNVELIDADGEDGEPDDGQYAVGQYTDALPVEPIDDPAPVRTVQPIRPKSGY
jgi:hypothetical protein